MHNTGLSHDEQLRQYQANAPFEHDHFKVPTTVANCTTQLQESKKDVACIVKESYARRDAERNQKIKDLEMTILVTDQESAQRLRRLRKAEDVNQLFSKLQSICNPGVRAGVTRIEVPVDPNADPKACIQWRQIEVPTEVLMHLQERNRKHFGQAKGTPFTVPLLS